MTTSPAQVPAANDPAGGRPRVVIVGSGFGGLFAAQALRKAPVDVTLIGKTSHHLFQPLLYQVATGILSEGEIAPADPRDPAPAGERPGRARRGHRHRPGRPHRHLAPCSAAPRCTPTTS